MKNFQGFVQVYTGNGKGKTTAAVGQGMRAAGQGLRVVMIQFMKGRKYGELASIENLHRFTVHQFGRDEFVDRDNPEPEDVKLAQQGLAMAAQIVQKKGCDLLILDEINVACDYRLIETSGVVNLLKEKPKGMEIILTGRYASPELMAMADTVTEMREVKHHYRQGIQARRGIEY
ncbi:cob(I)yrinic acid a,c-diamide adenosyltransferase [candidate division KSB1 bacterium]|nr:cob(I)yrinic acid a,c-diamide adenosyltransferase [candidate division KSB1 bacterium]